MSRSAATHKYSAIAKSLGLTLKTFLIFILFLFGTTEQLLLPRKPGSDYASIAGTL
jgi:hypothetical protein